MAEKKVINMDLYFSVNELCITDEAIPQDIADKLLKHHIWPMNVVRERLGEPIYASSNSGYRPESYERSKGRSGNSQHCFKGSGAVDWTAVDIDTLLGLILTNTEYTRVAYYPDAKFIHCDYKYLGEKGKQYFESADSKWKFIKFIQT